ncbi:unnamed protein product [Ceutorhynchus assimilis]|uniref:Uncharacterized protein n=1 Tax=Ceutorhynchus assimilis TaxID=467358 RepID=A0A9N9MYY9_9CUCU|nr:unnamed protein product [Ceutorhynchus assimilis]
MSSIKSIWKCMFSPKLYQIYGNGPAERIYEPLPLERWGDCVINSIYTIWKFGLYTSPFWGIILYNKGYLEPQGLALIMKFAAGMGVILIVSICFKGIGRAQNTTYQRFLEVLERAEENVTVTKPELMRYDFEFKSWPVEYDLSRQRSPISRSTARRSQNNVEYLMSLPFRMIAYLAIHTFGIRLIYPGSVGILQTILDSSLLQGRSRLVQLYKGERFKIKTTDENDIDTMFLDRRKSKGCGEILVICCEGNAGFYEIGTMITPIAAGYSVLGWNHPGFGGSTGMPYPSQEQNAVDAVMQFAMDKLNFKMENIIFFGWSIGGYTSSWAAMAYPAIKGVVIDATFDDIMPLAINHMPGWWEPIVKLAIREHVNLDVYEQLVKFNGPILLIRRSEDEVICIKDGNLSSNRGNDLLIKILTKRYPCIFGGPQLAILNDYLAVTGIEQERVIEKYNVDPSVCLSLIQSYISEHSKSFPMKIGEEFDFNEKNQMALFLATKYMKDFKATHCVPLPQDMFTVPWDVNVESDFVFT